MLWYKPCYRCGLWYFNTVHVVPWSILNQAKLQHWYLLFAVGLDVVEELCATDLSAKKEISSGLLYSRNYPQTYMKSHDSSCLTKFTLGVNLYVRFSLWLKNSQTGKTLVIKEKFSWDNNTIRYQTLPAIDKQIVLTFQEKQQKIFKYTAFYIKFQSKWIS